MIKSRTRTFGFWLMLIMTVCMLTLFVSAISQTYLDFTIIKMSMPTHKALIFQLTLTSLAALLFGLQVWRDGNFITIDTFSKTITFSNFFTRHKQTNEFNTFDGFIDMYQKSKGGSYRVIYLVKDRKYIKKISSFIYSNLDELQDGLSPIEYLGQQEYNILKSIKVLLNKQVLD